jgi:ParB-like chromosome segregation protein Spo0J
MLRLIITQKLTVRQAEHLARGFKAPASDAKTAVKRLETKNRWTETLEQRLGTNVAISRSAKGGRLMIDYKDDEDLGRITRQLLG